MTDTGIDRLKVTSDRPTLRSGANVKLDPDRTSGSVPKSRAIAQEIANWIQDGEYPVGSQLQSEPDLAERFNTSRVTIREALRELQMDGVLDRRHGLGTFVAAPHRPTFRIDHNFGVGYYLARGGRKASLATVRWNDEAPSDVVRQALKLDPDEKVWALELIRSADDIPVFYSENYFRRSMLANPVTVTESLHASLRQACGIAWSYADSMIRPMKAGRRIGGLLKIEPSDLLLLIEQVDCTTNDEPVLYSRDYHVADAFEFGLLRRSIGAES